MSTLYNSSPNTENRDLLESGWSDMQRRLDTDMPVQNTRESWLYLCIALALFGILALGNHNHDSVETPDVASVEQQLAVAKLGAEPQTYPSTPLPNTLGKNQTTNLTNQNTKSTLSYSKPLAAQNTALANTKTSSIASAKTLSTSTSSHVSNPSLAFNDSNIAQSNMLDQKPVSTLLPTQADQALLARLNAFAVVPNLTFALSNPQYSAQTAITPKVNTPKFSNLKLYLGAGVVYNTTNDLVGPWAQIGLQQTLQKQPRLSINYDLSFQAYTDSRKELLRMRNQDLDLLNSDAEGVSVGEPDLVDNDVFALDISEVSIYSVTKAWKLNLSLVPMYRLSPLWSIGLGARGSHQFNSEQSNKFYGISPSAISYESRIAMNLSKSFQIESSWSNNPWSTKENRQADIRLSLKYRW